MPISKKDNWRITVSDVKFDLKGLTDEEVRILRGYFNKGDRLRKEIIAYSRAEALKLKRECIKARGLGA